MKTVDRTGTGAPLSRPCGRDGHGYYDRPDSWEFPAKSWTTSNITMIKPYLYFRQRVIVIGARNSAAQVALELFRHGADVTLVHRGPAVSERVKPWIRLSLDARLRNGEIKAYFNTEVERIERDRVHCRAKRFNGRGRRGVDRVRRFTLPADFVLAMTGYAPDHSQLVALGVRIDPEIRCAVYDEDTMETNVPGVYVAGVAAGGYNPNILMIESGRFHGPKIAAHLARKLADVADGHRVAGEGPTSHRVFGP